MECWYQQQEDGRGDQGQMHITKGLLQDEPGGKQTEEDPCPDPHCRLAVLATPMQCVFASPDD